jgi:hypothetical protein
MLNLVYSFIKPVVPINFSLLTVKLYAASEKILD